MINLPDTTTEQGQCEASVMLARLMGWEYRDDEITGQWHSESGELLYDEWKLDTKGCGDVTFLSLYNPANMALAWRVLNWAMRGNIQYMLEDWLDERTSMVADSRTTILAPHWWILAYSSPAEAQRVWLDKILELAIEGGLLDAAAKEGE